MPHTPWPLITLVTPVRNAVEYIEQTIRSIVFQDYPNLEYVIIDGASTDGTVDIIRKYADRLAWWVSEPDASQFDAVNKAFARTKGEIMGWISGMDLLHVGSLFVLGSVFRDLAEVDWVTGIPTWFADQGMTVGVGQVPHWSRMRFLAGANRYIQNESTFWRRTLWEKAGGHYISSRRIAADFELWIRFFRHAQLYPVNALIGGYREHGDALTITHLNEVNRLYEQWIRAELGSIRFGSVIRLFRRAGELLQRFPMGKGLWSRAVLRALYNMRGPDWPPHIVREGEKWVLNG
jgi:glycosyltransferase involved in cell wall biosynthesis